MMMPRMRMPMRPMGPRGLRPRGPRPVPPPGVRPIRPGAPPMHPGAPMRPRLAPPPPQPVPAPSITGNATNDPTTANKRVFVGNLNTIAISKEEVERMFGNYGIITGISMHKGYAFVQFAYEHEARVACGSEDGKTYAGQKLDCNIASEPKKPAAAPPVGLKRPATGLQPVKVGGPSNQVGPPIIKKIRPDPQPTIKRTLVDLTGNTANKPDIRKPTTPTLGNAAVKKVAARDVLICGTCKTGFQSLHSLAQHKKVPCKLRFACKCQNNPVPEPESTDPTSLQCSTCNAEFSSAWALVQHCHQEHKMTIYKTEGQAQGDVTTVEEVVESRQSPQSGPSSRPDVDGRTFRCRGCPECFCNRRDLYLHGMQYHYQRGADINLPIQIRYLILQYAKLRMPQFYYDYLDVYVDRGDFAYCEMDTDSACMALSGPTFASIVKPDMKDAYQRALTGCCRDNVDPEWFPHTCCTKHAKYDKRTPGLFKVEYEGHMMIDLFSKTYTCMQKKKKKVVHKSRIVPTLNEKSSKLSTEIT